MKYRYLLCLLLISVAVSSEVTAFSELALTVYNDGYGVVKDTRTVSIDTGQSYVTVDDVAATIQPQTLVFRVLSTKQPIKILQQNFENNLVGKQALLKKYLNRNVTVYTNLDPERIVPVHGTLLGYSPSCLIKTQSGLEIFDDVNGIVLSDLPNGLLIQPSLVWKIKSPFEVKKEVKCEIDYRSTGFSWKADYNIIVAENEESIDLIGWVTINNNSGKKYKDARIKLIAGEVNTVPRPRMFLRARYSMSKGGGYGRSAPGAPLVTEKTLGDYHLYTISNRVTLGESSIKQIQFIPKISAIPIRKYYQIIVNTGGYPQKQISPLNMISFNNSKENKVGIPLPKGNIKYLKQDSEDGSLQLLKEGTIKHSPKNELIKLNVGTNSYLVARKIVKKERVIGFDGNWDAELELTLQNKFQKDIEVEFRLMNAYGDNLAVEVVHPEGFELEKVSVKERKGVFRMKGGEERRFRWRQEYQKPI